MSEREKKAVLDEMYQNEEYIKKWTEYDGGILSALTWYASTIRALLVRAEQAEDGLDIARANYQEVYGLEAERDALRAEAGRLREALQWCFRTSQRPNVGGGEETRIYLEEEDQARAALSSTPLSAAALERWKAMERVAGAVRHYRDVPRPEEGFWNAEVWNAEAQAWSELMDALAALDRTEEK